MPIGVGDAVFIAFISVIMGTHVSKWEETYQLIFLLVWMIFVACVSYLS